ncbi:hypothetical protein ACFFGV_08385 [Pontibacillus salicampi]|uniref:Phr family secreted Rap phosphatase inhibitor n=1 Tax=Pontibacillus salicampi TaxID=1449801 RepID=A0ABV6LMG4_9BACI
MKKILTFITISGMLLFTGGELTPQKEVATGDNTSGPEVDLPSEH